VGQDTYLADRYRLVSPLGRGGMGQVWEAQDERLGRPVAVKLLTHQALTGSPAPEDGIRRFTREAAVTAGLSHPGVPTIYDAGEYDGGMYLVMELVSGVTVADLIAEQGPLPVPWAAAIGAQVGAVLAGAHARGVVHRDIKPANVMVAGDGTAKILDFGVAGIVSQRITSTGVALGTPAYMAPEQLQDHPATPASDLYALGCLLYEMLSGSPVFSATSPAALIRMHLEQAPTALARTDVPVPLTQLVWQLLAKDASWRPSGAQEVCDRLLAFAGTAGTLGDIDPASADAAAVRRYALVLARMADGRAGAAAPAPAAMPLPMARARAADGAASRGTGPGGTGPGGTGPGGMGSGGMAWRVWHSLWILPTLLLGGFGAWLSFGYVAAVHRRLTWLVAAAVYFVVGVGGFILVAVSPGNGTGPTSWQEKVGLAGFVLVWPVGLVHALWLNFSARLPLMAQRRKAR